jgi:hypothetical protein
MLPPFSVLKIEAVCSSGMLVSCHKLHHATAQKITILTLTTMKTSKFKEHDAVDFENINWIELSNNWFLQ